MQVVNQHVTPGTRAKWEKTEDGFLRCRARVLREGVMPYRREEFEQAIPPEVVADPIMMHVSLAEMAEPEALRSLEGASVVVGSHEWITPTNAATASHGHVAGAPRFDGPYLEIDLLVTDPRGIALIESGLLPEISAGYHATSLFGVGAWNGNPYDAQQTKLRYNHIAVIPEGHGRAGTDVKILNKGDSGMNTKVKLPRTGRFINTDDDGARAVESESQEAEKSTQSFEDAMGQLEEKNAAMSQLQQEIEGLKSELQTYKTKLDELMSDEAAEGKALEMIADQHQSDDIVENEMDEDEKKEEVKNSIKTLHGIKLYHAVLNAIGVDTEGMSDEAVKGAWKAQGQIAKMGRKTRAVSGASMTGKMMNTSTPGAAGVKQRTPHERLGFVTKQ